MFAFLRAGIIGLSHKTGLFYLLICIAVINTGITAPQGGKFFKGGQGPGHYGYHSPMADNNAARSNEHKAENQVISAEGMVTVQSVHTSRVELKTQTITEEIEPEVQFIPDASLPQGTVHVEDEGTAGVLEMVYQITLVDGKEEHRELLEVKVLQEAMPRLIMQGMALRTQGVARDSIREGVSWQGKASWYGGNGDGFHGRKTASGEIFDRNVLTAAHPFLPFDTIVSVTHLKAGKEVLVRINDRGPFIEGRIIDLSRAAAEAIGMRYVGVAKVKVKIITLP